MIIWIVNHYAISPRFPGGTRHYDMARELVMRGHKVIIFASSFHYSLLKETVTYSDGKYFKQENLDGVKFIWIKTPPYARSDWKRVLNMLSFSYRFFKIGMKMAELKKPDVIIGSSVHLFAVLSAYMVARRYRTRFFMEVRDLWPQTLIDMGISKFHPFIILLSVIEKFLYRKAEVIIVLLPGAPGYIRSKGVKEKKIVWLPNFVDISRMENLEKLEQNNNNNRFVITFMGSFSPTNNIFLLLEVAKLLKKENVIFQLYGDGVLKEKMKEFIKKHELPNIKLYPPVPKKDIIKIIQSTDAFVVLLRDMPLYKYGISLNKIYDYLASGKPVIFSGKSINNPISEAGAGFTVPPDDKTKLAEAILKLKSLPYKDRIILGHNGREYIMANNTSKIIVDKLERLFYSGRR